MSDATRQIPELRTDVERHADGPGRLVALMALGEALFNVAPQEGLRCASEALAIAERLGDERATADARLLLGRTCVNVGELRRAREELERAVVELERLGDRAGVARALLSMGLASKGLSEYTTALAQYESSLGICGEIGDLRGAANATMNIGSMFVMAGDMPTALERLQEALLLHEKAGNLIGAAAATGNLGAIHGRLGDHARALELGERSLEMFEELGDASDIAIALGNIADAYAHLGQHDASMQTLARALPLFEEIGDREGLARVNRQIGNAHAAAGRHDDALRSLELSLAIAEEMGDIESASTTLADIGLIYAQETFAGHDAQRAETTLLRAVELMTGVGATSLLPWLHREISDFYQRHERWRTALEHLSLSHEIEEEQRAREAARMAEQLALRRQIELLEQRRELERIEEQAVREALSLRAQLLEAQVDRQRAELASQALGMAKQVELLASFRKGLQAIIAQGGDPATVVRRVIEKLGELPEGTVDWSRFEAEFRTSYPDFQASLIARCPALTGAELKVCALLKLRLRSEEIARVLSLSERSVEGHRLRIRRKLGLVASDDLHEALAAI